SPVRASRLAGHRRHPPFGRGDRGGDHQRAERETDATRGSDLVTATDERLVLASKSAARRAMLEGAGVPFAVQSADVDEDAVKASHDPADAAGLAEELARVKALAVSRRDPDAWVLGADQTLAFDGGLVSKAGSLE